MRNERRRKLLGTLAAVIAALAAALTLAGCAPVGLGIGAVALLAGGAWIALTLGSSTACGPGPMGACLSIVAPPDQDQDAGDEPVEPADHPCLGPPPPPGPCLQPTVCLEAPPDMPPCLSEPPDDVCLSIAPPEDVCLQVPLEPCLEATPRICLSDDIIEGELVPPTSLAPTPEGVAHARARLGKQGVLTADQVERLARLKGRTFRS